MSGKCDSSLRVKIDFDPDRSALSKAICAFKAAVLTRRALLAIARSHGDREQDFTIRWGVFDGADVDAQPIHDALVEAYEHGKEDGVTGPPPVAATDTEGQGK